MLSPKKIAKTKPAKKIAKPKPEPAKKPAKKPAKVTKPKGSLAPAPIPQPPEGALPPIVHVKCRRGSDKLTEGQTCGGLRAYNESRDRSSARFRCVKCNFSWSVQVGGEFILR